MFFRQISFLLPDKFLVLFSYRKTLLWIGCKYEQDGFMWTQNNQRLAFTKWSPGYPNMTSRDACCVIDSSEDGRWKDVSCGSLRITQFICKRSGKYQKQQLKTSEKYIPEYSRMLFPVFTCVRQTGGGNGKIITINHIFI